MPHSRDEVQAAFERYVSVRDGINAGNGTWADLAQFFTDDAVFIDPAWGRVEGIDEMKATVLHRPGPDSGSLSLSPIPMRSGAIRRPRPSRCGMMLRHRYEEVGLP